MVQTLTIAPSGSANLNETPEIYISKPGDGFIKRRPKGLNTILQQWSLSFNDRTNAEKDNLLALFRATKGSDYFLWTPPGEENAIVDEQFGTGDASRMLWQVNALHTPSVIKGNATIYRTDWQGKQILYPNARTNYALRSQDFNLWTVNTGLVVTPNTITAPDGTLTADTLAGSGGTIGYASIIPTMASGTAVKVKCWVKNIDSTQSVLYVRTAVDGGRLAINWSGSAISNLSASAGASNGQFIAYPNGWYLVSCDITTTEVNQILRIYPDAFTTNKSIYAWGYSVSKQDGAYIPTTTAAVTVTDYSLDEFGWISFSVVPAIGARLSWDGSVARKFFCSEWKNNFSEFNRNSFRIEIQETLG